MVKFLMNNLLVAVDATKKAKVEFKRGAFVKANESTGELALATATADVTGIVVRDVVVTRDVALGYPVSDFSDEQDIVKAGELCGHRALFSGEQFATDQHNVADADGVAGAYLAVANGKLVKSTEATKFVSLGFQQVAGHKLLAFKVL